MAFDMCTSVVSEIIKDLVCETIRQAHYPFRFNKYVKDLVTEKGNLSSQRASVEDRVIKAKEETQKIDNVVEKWLDEAQTLINDATSLEEMAKTNKSCYFGRCPNLTWRFCVARQMEKKTKEIVVHNEKSKFERLATPPGMTSSEGFMLFDSIKSAYHQLLQALKDDEVFMIGLYGMGGCGKTTLAKQVGKAALELFNKVVFVVVSNVVNIQKIQDSLASQLRVQLEEKGETERAQRLWLRLTSGEKILIVLDDVWENLDFEAIGIPFGTNYWRCKVLLTTRRQEVCTLMDCQRVIHLNLLTEGEAWTLFQHHAKISNITPDNLKDVAQKIAYECKGLAVAIAAVGSSLKQKNLAEWEEAWDTLRESKPMDIEKGLRDPYACLKLSYDYLDNDHAKSIFLLCSVFPEDYEIEEEELAKYGIGLGLFGKTNSFKTARNRFSVAKDKLIGSCLLMKTDDGNVKMHDLVRDVALRIAKEGNLEIVGPERCRDVLKEDAIKKENSIRYLWLDEVDSFPDEVCFPKLLFLCVHLNDVKMSILTDECYKEMEKLRVLVLQSRFFLGENQFLSTSFQLLTNLHCLKLEGLDLGDISFLGSVKKLQSLTLRRCFFYKLPDEIIELDDLRLLDVNSCRIKKNPYEVMGRCSKLEELYFIKNKISPGEHKKEHAANIFGKTELAPKLQRYMVDFESGFYLRLEDVLESRRAIAVELFDVVNATATIKDLIKRAEIVCLRTCDGGFNNVIPDMIQRIGGMNNELMKLVLYSCEDTEFVVDAATSGSVPFKNIFSKLVELVIGGMKSLKAFYGGTCPNANQMLNMRNLKVLKLSVCPLLTHIFTFDFAESLVMLEELQVFNCNGLQHLLIPEMQLNQQRSSLVFHKLKSLYVYNCEQLEYLFAQTNQEGQSHDEFCRIEFPILKKLSLSSLPNLISICRGNDYSTFPSLADLWLRGCLRLNIRSMNDLIVDPATLQEFEPHSSQVTYEASPFQVLQNVKSIRIQSCHIECVFQLTGLLANTESNTLVSYLRDLDLFDLPELRSIIKGPTQCINFQNLDSMTIGNCRELKCIFSLCIVRTSLSQMRELRIDNCEKLEQIIEDEESFDSLKRTSNSFGRPIQVSQNTGSFNLCSLESLIVTDCPLLTSLFTQSTAETLTSLTYLDIKGCERLRYVIRDERVEGNKSGEIAHDDGHPILANLVTLILEDLPNLIDVYPGIKLQSESVKYYRVYKCPKLVQEFPRRPGKHRDRISEDQEEELEDKAVEEYKLVPYDPTKAAKKIILDDEAGPSGTVAIPGLPFEPCIAPFGDPTSSLPISHILALPLEASDPSSSSSAGEAHASFRDAHLDQV